MRDAAKCRWQQWRVTLVVRPTADRFVRRAAGGDLLAAGQTAAREQPGPDGIRHDLVARVRREIEAGTYDTEAKWLAAEELLLRRVGGTV
jgi:hypothetical protein